MSSVMPLLAISLSMFLVGVFFYAYAGYIETGKFRTFWLRFVFMLAFSASGIVGAIWCLQFII